MAKPNTLPQRASIAWRTLRQRQPTLSLLLTLVSCLTLLSLCNVFVKPLLTRIIVGNIHTKNQILGASAAKLQSLGLAPLTGHCPGKNRITLGGSNGREGSWGICLSEELVARFHRQDCIVYSFGIQNDWSFDAAIAQLGCEVWSYDPSSLHLKDHSDLDKNVHFQRVGVGLEDTTRWIVEDPNHGGKWDDVPSGTTGAHKFQIKTLHTLMAENNHDRIDLLKIDVEGFEWGLLQHWVAQKEAFDHMGLTHQNNQQLAPVLDRIGQLVAEVHFWPSPEKAKDEKGGWPATEMDMATILHGMGRHFDLWRREENELGFENGRAYLRGEGSCCFDVGWIKKQPYVRGAEKKKKKKERNLLTVKGAKGTVLATILNEHKFMHNDRIRDSFDSH